MFIASAKLYNGAVVPSVRLRLKFSQPASYTACERQAMKETKLPSPLAGLEPEALRALHEAALAIVGSTGYDAPLQTIIDAARRLAGAHYGALAVLDEEGAIDQFLTSGLSLEDRDAIGGRPEGRGLLGLMLQGTEPVRADRIDAHPASSGFPPNHPPMTSFLGVPITIDNRIAGSLYLTDKAGALPFAEQDEQLLQALAAYASLAIEHSRLLHDEREQVEQWHMLFDVGREITEALRPEMVLQSIVTRTCRLLGTDMSLMTALTDDGNHLRTVASEGLKSEAMRSLYYRVDQGMAQQILARGSVFVVDDYQDDSRLSEPLNKATGEEGIVSVIGAPLVAHGDLLGILYAANRTSTRFTERDRELFDAFAQLAAIALEHSRLFAATNDALQVKVVELEEATGALRHRSAQVLSAQEEERRRLARDLHDQTAGQLATLRVRLRLVEKLGSVDKMRNGLADLRELAGQALDDVRAMAAALRPAVLDDLGLSTAVRWYSGQFTTQWGIPVELMASGLDGRLPAHVELAAYRIAQEALHNVGKHAEAGSVRVDLEHDGPTLTIRVADDGRGFRVRKRSSTSTEGLGIAGMRERAELVGGELRIDSRPGNGTIVVAVLPTEQEPG